MKFSKIFKPSFYLKEIDSNGILLKDSIKLLKELMNMTDAIPATIQNSDGNIDSDRIKINSYLKGINDKCLQFEILYEIETNENKLIEDNVNLANYYISLMNKNIEYNIVSKKAKDVDLYSEPGKVKLTIDEEELFYDVKAVKMNDNPKYYKSFCEFVKSIKKSAVIKEYKVYGIDDKVEFNLEVDSLDNITMDAVGKETIILEKPITMKECIVLPIGPILEPDMRRNWKIKFTPELPENLILDSDNEFSALIKDKKYFKGDFLIDSFKVGDILKCNLSYIVYHEQGSFLCRIKKVEVNDVIKHKHK